MKVKAEQGKKKEEILLEIYSMAAEKVKEQIQHQLVIELDIAKKSLTNDYFNALAIIESELTFTIDCMLKENVKTTSESLDSLFVLCDKLRENAKKYEMTNSSRYKRMMEEIEEREKNGWDLIMLRSKELIDKYQRIFEKTTKLLNETKEKYPL